MTMYECPYCDFRSEGFNSFDWEVHIEKHATGVLPVTKNTTNPPIGARGFTLRDWFAGQALSGITSRPDLHMAGWDHASGMAYEYADAMMRAREAKDDE